ncbi:type II toxin-antitoxin system Phd/YefM family antitoxin [Gloeobacter morelensis]|uniref:DUF2281 domain-containing protein n=1 Tax=Gloeobacter morelensis MG652769 TaxID=2781736 RepID=A0ABY3PNQ2_9CYAN|nr:DUF2281 domain-containing protein [Gloeobacter morelensis]UFP95330.1 DUF2281 domain-containing protein [Gloeobacter morelensis MG652769]
MYTVQISEALLQLDELLHQAAAGQEVVIVHPDGTAVRLVPVEPKGQPRFGSARELFTMADDFDKPLDDFAAYQ